MTLFESARIYNESGQMLNHDNFDHLGSSPDVTSENNSNPKRKLKRRVGRHRHEMKRSNAADTLKPDEVVIELMCVLFPGVEVTHEINLLLLGGAQHDDVFRFDEDDVDGIPTSKPKTGVLDIDLLKFQAALTTMLFHSNSSIQKLPSRGALAEALLKLCFTPRWISCEMLAMIELDVLAQYDRFAVMVAIFRMIPTLRPSILTAARMASLAIFQHQSLVEIKLYDTKKDLVTVKGMIAFLKEAIYVIEWDARYNVNVFGNSDDEIHVAISGLCGQMFSTMKLLVRSSPGGCGNVDVSCNQLEKYAQSSDSAEATSYRAMGEVINRLTAFSWRHGEEFLQWMLHKWPLRNVQLQLFFVRFLAGLLSQFMMRGLILSAEVLHRTFSRIADCIKSTHFLVAQEACNMCQNFQLMSMYLACNQALRERVASALHENALHHWNRRIREISDKCFDRLLDLA